MVLVTTVNVLPTSTPFVPEVEEAVGVEEMDLASTGLADGAGEEMAMEKVATAIFKDPSFVVSYLWSHDHHL